MGLHHFFILFHYVIKWSQYFDKEEVKVVKDSGFMKLAMSYCTTDSTSYTNFRFAFSMAYRLGQYHFPELVEFCIDFILKSDENELLFQHVKYVVEALFHSQAKISEDKRNQFLSLAASSFIKNFEVVSGK